MARRNNLMCVRFGYMCCVFEMSGLKTNLIKTSRRRDDDERWKAAKEKEDSNNKFAELLSCCWYIKKSDARFRSLICGIEMTKTITTIRRFFFPLWVMLVSPFYAIESISHFGGGSFHYSLKFQIHQGYSQSCKLTWPSRSAARESWCGVPRQRKNKTTGRRRKPVLIMNFCF